MNKIYKLLEITPQNEIELNYLISLSEKFEILDKVKEHIFQFAPTFDENGRNQTFSSFYKVSMILELSYKMLEEFAKTNQNLKDSEFATEHFTDYFYNLILDNKETPKKCVFLNFILTNNLNDLNIEDIIKLYTKETKTEIQKYFKNIDTE